MECIRQDRLWDKNVNKAIVKCYINSKGRFKNEVSVVYEDGIREVIFGYNPNRIEYASEELLGLTKLDAMHHYSRKLRESFRDYYAVTAYAQ